MKQYPRESTYTGKRYGSENQLEVRNQIDGRYYEVHCTKCALDPELHGKALYKTRFTGINKGAIPCGCSEAPRWTVSQKKLMIERKLKNYENVKLLDTNTDFKEVKLLCTKHNKEFTNSYYVLIYGKGGNCKECRAEILRNTHQLDIDQCNKQLSKIQPNLTIIANDVGKGRVAVMCEVCSGDRLVEEGYCSGIFYKSFNSMLRGEKPCRCHKQFMYKLPQKIKRVEYMLEHNGREFELISTFQRDESHGEVTLKADWGSFWCDIHGEFQRSLTRMIQRQQGCPTCDLKFGGFDESKPAVFYLLTVRGFVSDFVGFGISSQFDKRITDHKTNLKKSGYIIDTIETFTMSGSYARLLESQVKNNFDTIPIEVEGFRRESVNLGDYLKLKYFVQEYVDNIKQFK